MEKIKLNCSVLLSIPSPPPFPLFPKENSASLKYIFLQKYCIFLLYIHYKFYAIHA